MLEFDLSGFILLSLRKNIIGLNIKICISGSLPSNINNATMVLNTKKGKREKAKDFFLH
jgi:hypothetical protein